METGQTPPAATRGTGRARRRPWRRRLLLSAAVLAAGLAVACVYELRTSALEARALADWDRSLTWVIGPGPSPSILFPTHGPFDESRGYTRLPHFVARFAQAGFHIRTQAVFSSGLRELARYRINLPYEEPATVGLIIRAANGRTLFDATPEHYRFLRYEEIPPLLVETLLLIENRELGMPTSTTKNPAVEWDRLAKAGLLYLGSAVGLPVRVEGASTLAVQLEKFRHSEAGRTDDPPEKLRQILSASLKAYAQGTDTLARRREVVLDYLNTMPLGATRGYGELYGLGEGLYAWFGLELDEVKARLMRPALDSDTASAYKHALALLIAVKAPTTYLARDQSALEARLGAFLKLLEAHHILDPRFAELVAAAPLRRLPEAPKAPPVPFTLRKGANLVRKELMSDLEVPGMYDLDRLHLTVDTTLDAGLQDAALDLFARLRDGRFVAANGLQAKRLLAVGDPARVLYSLLLVERTPDGNYVRAHVDSLEQPFDLNTGMKLELGSTGKLRTLAHYLEVVEEAHFGLAGLPVDERESIAATVPDPITRWAANEMVAQPKLDLEGLLERALDRRYSASPDETFFTGSGEHRFHNFDPDDDRLVLSVREATWRSTNLVFIRLIRDLVAYHAARLPYEASEVLRQPNHPDRRRLLEEEADAEASYVLFRSFRQLRELPVRQLEAELLGSKAVSPSHLAMLYFAWNGPGDQAAFASWLRERVGEVDEREVQRLHRAYGRPELGLLDFAGLLNRHPLEVWCAGQLAHQPGVGWPDLLARSDAARRESTSWLFLTRQRRAQDLRLRIRIEKDAFLQMTPYWQRLGFPFDRLVPSYATAIGASGDRPTALAELMGIIVNGGERLPLVVVRGLSFAAGTPYATRLERAPVAGERVMAPAVARVLRRLLTGVVQGGTAGGLAGVFRDAQGNPLPVGGKTGSGDNRFKTFSRSGEVISSQAVNRTAGFVFFVGDRLFGVITAYVPGEEAETFKFTSSLPVAVLRLLAPTLDRMVLRSAPEAQPTAARTASPP